MDYKTGEILAFNKPLTWTSFAIVNKVRYLLCRHLEQKKLKVGHAGTLDPLATGVLIICTGKATKQIDVLQAKTKEYEATLQLGSTTPSFDLETPVDATYPTKHITRELIDTALRQFVGRIEQVPPTYSACKVNGHRAYDLARKGQDVELKPKVLVIDKLDVLDFNPEAMTLDIRVTCSKGTYIRALARDIGQALSSGAHLIRLCRTRVGDYTLDDCVEIDDFPAWLTDHPQTENKEIT
ncbi:MAG: tRNA pseudouridine(55) synthase TruB [Bacteroidaceae bacterium]|nr:tRNA pseudouridine(55) synthase TruB [Bacteroidaceae bacterium]